MLSDDFLPLRADIATWDDVPLYPADVFGAPDDALLDRLYWTGFEFIEGETTLSAELAIGWEGVEEIAFPLMGSQGISLMLGGGDSTSVAFSTTFADDGLQVAVTSRIGLRFGMDLIRPVTLQNGEYVALDDAIYEVAFEDATVTLSTSGDLTFENLDTLDFAPFAIGETGLVVAPGAVTLCFSADVAESLMVAHPDAGLNAGFRGVFIADGSVHFPETFPIESVTIRNAFIGNLGFTGALQANIGDPDASVVGRNACMGFPFALRSVSLSFVQNALTGFAIEGDLTIPFFDKTVGVALGLGVDGALTIGLSDPNGLANLTLEQIGTLKVTGFAIIIDGIDVGLMLSGSLLLSVAGLQWPEIGVQELLIRPDGTVSVSGGWLKLQAPLAVDLFGFRLEISQIGFGKEDDGRSWIGFSGGLHLIDLLPTGASVEGMRILWQPGANLTPQITLQGVGIALAVPGALEFTGDVTMVNEADDHYFAGSAELVLTPLGITLDAVVKIGHNADLDFNYVYIFLSLQLPVGIPLWASGTALYGIAGLLGVNVEPDTTGGDWYGWYAGPPQFNITDDSKWRGALDSMAFGAGITLGTVFDTGFTISTKALVALLLPGPVILFNGKANFLQLPPGLLDNSEGSLNMLAVLDARAGTFLFTIDAGWELPQVVDVQASAEAYFDFARPENWHVYLGQDQPDERRIRANVLALFNADAYLMIDHQGIAAGFGVDFGDEWRFGPVQVALKSWIASGAAITWTPAQLEGQLGLGGEFSIGVAGFSAGISAEASLSGKAPKPYWIRGDLTVRLNLPAPIKDLEENILLEWKQDLPPGLQDPFSSISLEHLKVSETWTPRLSGTDSEPTDAGYDAGPVVPLDARPLLVFDRAVLDNSGLNNVNAQYGGSTAIGDYTFDYTLDPDSIRLEKWPKAGAGGWTAFDSADLDGAWAVEVDGEGKASASKLQIMAKTPFAFTRRTSRTYADWFLAAYPGWPCGEAVAAIERCVDWHGVEFQDVSGTAFVHEDLTFLSEFAMWLDGGQFMPACPDPAGRALHFSYTLWILFPEPVRRV
ncbi:MAG: hypothetical protein IT323_00450, partial [Anaerolineae bacterium]|nr:hypothetical protein [Anaerolineae bacterium]